MILKKFNKGAQTQQAKVGAGLLLAAGVFQIYWSVRMSSGVDDYEKALDRVERATNTLRERRLALEEELLELRALDAQREKEKQKSSSWW